MPSQASQASPKAVERPKSWANWRAFLEEPTPAFAHEFLLYSDSSVIGTSREFGPYRVMNLMAGDKLESSLARPVMALRTTNSRNANPNPESTDVEHGKRQEHEITALMSLLFGVRLQAGGRTRSFVFDDEVGDPLGDPRAEAEVERPFLLPGAWTTIVSSACRPVDMDELDLLESYPKLDAKYAAALVRAARLYQEGLWLAERETWLSWLLLVSAVEAVAGVWKHDGDETLAGLLRDLAPSLASVCQDFGDDCVNRVAETQVHSLGATKKFLEFLVEFMPPPPAIRSKHYQQEWSPDALRRSLKLVYSMRSNHLHAGDAIPKVLCLAPMPPIVGPPAERHWDPHAESVDPRRGHIIDESLPMYLHVFEYIVRSAILKWWAAQSGDAHSADV